MLELKYGANQKGDGEEKRLTKKEGKKGMIRFRVGTHYGN